MKKIIFLDNNDFDDKKLYFRTESIAEYVVNADLVFDVVEKSLSDENNNNKFICVKSRNEHPTTIINKKEVWDMIEKEVIS